MNHTFNLDKNVVAKIKKLLPDLVKLVKYEPKTTPYKAVPFNKTVSVKLI